MTPDSLLIIHTNDIQDAPTGAFSRLAARIEDTRRSWNGSCLLLHAGDGFPFLDLMPHCGFDAVGLGNEDLTPLALPSLMREGSHLPVVCANLEIDGRVPAWCLPYKTFQFDGLTVSVVGLVTGDERFYLRKRYAPSVRAGDPFEAAAGVLPLARRESDLMIVLYHGDLDDRRRLSREFPYIDVLLSGHDHLLSGYGCNGRVIVSQAHSNMRSIGKLRLTLNDRHVASWSGAFATTFNYARTHPAVDAQIRHLFEEGPEAEVIGEAVADFRPDRYWLDLDGENVNLRSETLLGNWLLDLMRGFACADVAIQKAWGIHHDVAPGPIRRSKLREILPYDEEIWLLDLPGGDLLASLRHSFGRTYDNVAFSGMEITVDLCKRPDERLQQVLVGGRKLDPAAIYSVATSDFLAGGNTGFRWMSNAVSARPLGVTIHELVIDELRRDPNLGGAELGRLNEIASGEA